MDRHNVYRVWRVCGLVQAALLPTLEHLLEMLHKLADIGRWVGLFKLLEVTEELLELVHIVHDLRIAMPLFASDIVEVARVLEEFDEDGRRFLMLGLLYASLDERADLLGYYLNTLWHVELFGLIQQIKIAHALLLCHVRELLQIMPVYIEAWQTEHTVDSRRLLYCIEQAKEVDRIHHNWLAI